MGDSPRKRIRGLHEHYFYCVGRVESLAGAVIGAGALFYIVFANGDSTTKTAFVIGA